MEELPLDALVELFERRLDAHREVLGDVVDLAPVVLALVGPGLEHVSQRLFGVGHHERLVDLLGLADPLTARTGTVWGVERERAGLELGEVDPTVCAGQLLGERHHEPAVVLASQIAGPALAAPHILDPLGWVRQDHLQQPLGLLERGLDRVGDPRAGCLTHADTVDDDVDRVVVVLV